MNILEAVLGAQNGNAAREAGKAAGLSPDQVTSALSALVPQLASGLQRNAAQPGGLESLVGALTGGRHAQYVDDTAALGRADTVADGNSILGHILGSKDASRAVASQAASQTGLDVNALKKLLPIAATMVMGSLSKQTSQGGVGGLLANAGGSGGGILGMLAPMLDQNKDGSVMDDITKMFGR